jgi:hypothetical protein
MIFATCGGRKPRSKSAERIARIIAFCSRKRARAMICVREALEAHASLTVRDHLAGLPSVTVRRPLVITFVSVFEHARRAHG